MPSMSYCRWTNLLTEARDLIAAMYMFVLVKNTDKPWTFGDTEKALSLLEWAVPEIERLEQEAKLERLRVASANRKRRRG